MQNIDIKSLVDDDELRLRWMPGNSTSLVVVFSGVQHNVGGLPLDEFVGTASEGARNHVLFVSDVKCSWFSRPQLNTRILDAINTFIDTHQIQDVVAIGNSMGGYGAILFSDRLPFRIVAAFSPQISMHPDVIEENRWAHYRHFIGPDLALSLSPHVKKSRAQIFVTFGAGDQADQAQAALLPDVPHLKVFHIKGCHRNVVRRLKEAGLNQSVVAAKFAGDGIKLRALYDQFEQTHNRLTARIWRKLKHRLTKVRKMIKKTPLG